MINVGIIGYGYWGPNIARNFNICNGANLISICDTNNARLDLAKSTYPFVKLYDDPKNLIQSNDIDAVAIVTPVFMHYELAKQALECGKHVFVEKPFTSTVAQGAELIELAEKKGLTIMVDHTYLFTGTVKKMQEVILTGQLGSSLFFYDSVRVNLGLFHHDVNVAWDLVPHDFSIMNYLIEEKPIAISASGSRHFGRKLEDVAYITVHFESSFIAHFHCNWLSPVKVRKTLVSGDRKMLVWDDISPDEKLKIYDKGVEVSNVRGVHDLLVSYRSGGIYIPKVDNMEALKAEVEYFVWCIEKDQKPFNDGEAGLQIVRMLEAVDESMKNDCRKISL